MLVMVFALPEVNLARANNTCAWILIHTAQLSFALASIKNIKFLHNKKTF